MRFALTKEHLDFYYRYHYIELEDLLSPKEVEELETSIDKLLPEDLSGKELYKRGYDSWRKDPTIKKIVLRKTLAEVASELTKKRALRIAFDVPLTGKIGEVPLFDHPMTLDEISSVKPITCGLLLHLSSQNPPEDPLPKKPGNGVFFSPRHPFSFDYLSKDPTITQLLITYTNDHPLYTLNPIDPNTHVLKRSGYVFGDSLATTTHPFVLKP
ncbi:MAG: hypothetical protein KDK76_00040 [Chlamydiia bacterium]|nr:hypothetical protein [Chlamydiia bacterium]